MSAAQYAAAVRQAGFDLGITPKGIVIGFATVFVETNWLMYVNALHQDEADAAKIHYDAVGSDGLSDGLFQQQPPWWGTLAQRMDAYQSAKMFFTSLAKLNYESDAQSPGSYAQAVQQSAFPDRYDERMADAQHLYDNMPEQEAPPVTDPNRPSFNEFPIWSSSAQDRDGTKVDLFLIHTQEGGGGDSAAEDLANYLANPANQVSYHYTVSQASDGGVTVVDCVDTDEASWSVGSANDRSINLCFAGSAASWSRAQWLAQSNAIDVAAYLAVQDCKKYGIPLQFIGTGGDYDTSKTAGVADHRYVTDILGWGTHTDVGTNFPDDVFVSSFKKYADLDTEQPPADPPVDPPPPVTDPLVAFNNWVAAATDRELLEYAVRQIGPGDPAWTSKNKTLRDKVFGV